MSVMGLTLRQGLQCSLCNPFRDEDLKAVAHTSSKPILNVMIPNDSNLQVELTPETGL
jgi:hypothetical protein